MTRTFTAHSSLGEELQFRALSGEERISGLFEFRVTLLSKQAAIPAKSLLGQDLSIELDVSTPLSGPGTRYLSGQITQFAQTGREGDAYRYEALLRPWLWHASLRTDFRIFQHTTVPEIVQEVLAPYGFLVESKLTEAYRTWEYLVQYNESDFNFISRLLEHEGAYYYFAHELGRHTLVLADGIGSHGPLPSGAQTLAFRGESGAGKVHEDDIIDHWGQIEDIAPGRFAANDYDFQAPAAYLHTDQEHRPGHSDDGREVYAWPGGYTARSDGETYARIRLEQQQAQRALHFGQGNARNLAPGYYLDLSEHPDPEQNQTYLVLSTHYHFTENLRRSDGPGAGGTHTTYRVNLEAIPSSLPWRSPRLTPKPRTHGPQTAVVTGPASEEIYTDQYGRVKVQFHWDRYGQRDEHSSCWIRVSQTWAGAGYGSMHLPRIGQEVIVDFLNGDPDAPIITGRVYNALQMPPWDLPANKTQSGIKTRSSQGGTWGDGEHNSPGTANALRFEDKIGEEQLWLHAQKDQLTEVEHDEDKWVGNDRRKTIDGHETTHIGKTRTEDVGEHETITIGTDRTRVVRRHDQLLVGADKRDAITRRYLIEAGEQLRLVCGQSVFELNANGQVNLTCENFNITAAQSGEINTLGGALDLNIGGRTAGAEPAGMGVLDAIHTEVESWFSEDGKPPITPALAGAQALPGMATALDSAAQAGGVVSRATDDDADAADSDESGLDEETRAKKERWDCRKGQIAASRERLESLPEGPEKAQLQATTERFERNNEAVEKARLSEATYPPQKVPTGWNKVDLTDPEKLKQYGLKPDDLTNGPDSNFGVEIYEPDPAVFGDDMQPTIAFKGSEPKWEDWFENNIPQAFDRHSEYYEKAVKIGTKIERSGMPVDFTGHSLGGGTASAASQASGRPAITFNAAGLHPNTVERYGGEVHETDIQAYRVKGDPLTSLQEGGWGLTAVAAGAGSAIGALKGGASGAVKGAAIGAVARWGLAAMLPDAVGTPHELKKIDHPEGPHSIAHVIESIEAQKTEDQHILASATGKTCG